MTDTLLQPEEIQLPTRQRTAPKPRRHSSFTVGRIVLVIVIVLFSAYFLLPLAWLIISSTKDNGQLVTSFGFWFALPLHLWQNITGVFTEGGGVYLRWMGNSLLISSSVAVGSTVLCALAGYAFSKFEFVGKRALFAVVLGAVMVPNTALVLPIFLLLSKAHLIDTYWAVILPQLVFPLGLYLCRIFWTDSLPDELIDAARVDGASEIRTFLSIGLPLMKNGLTTVALLAFVASWNNLFLPLVVLSHTTLFPVVQGLAAWNMKPASGVTVNNGVVLLGALISILPLVVAFFGLARYWQSGLTAGATKE